ncbi:hypothetical protein D3C81_1880540 [compost metagenome]
MKSNLTSPMLSAPTCIPLMVPLARVVPSILMVPPVAKVVAPIESALALTVLSMAMAWPALAPTWNSWLENEPSRSFVPLNSDCLATRSISLTSWVTSA